MVRRREDGSAEGYVAFIPTKYASVGRTIGIKFGDEWREGFVIDAVGKVTNISDVDLAREDHKRFRWVLGE
jgi:hypothetical protein